MGVYNMPREKEENDNDKNILRIYLKLKTCNENIENEIARLQNYKDYLMDIIYVKNNTVDLLGVTLGNLFDVDDVKTIDKEIEDVSTIKEINETMKEDEKIQCASEIKHCRHITIIIDKYNNKIKNLKEDKIAFDKALTDLEKGFFSNIILKKKLND